MTQCDKIQLGFDSAAGQELPADQAEQFARHLESCADCRQEAQKFQKLTRELASWELPAMGDLFFARQAREIGDRLGEDPQATEVLATDLRELPLPAVSEEFFARQRKSILAALQVEAEAAPDWASLEAELKALSLSSSREEFFTEQRQTILQGIASDSEAAFLEEELRDLPVADPGELFFRRQAKAIGLRLHTETRREGIRSWFKPLAVAAALFLLVLGVSRINRLPQSVPSAQWHAALEYMAENEDEEGVGLETIDELNQDQLERLANNIEGRILRDSGEQWMEEPADIEDLNEQELQLLIQRLENKVQT